METMVALVLADMCLIQVPLLPPTPPPPSPLPPSFRCLSSALSMSLCLSSSLFLAPSCPFPRFLALAFSVSHTPPWPAPYTPLARTPHPSPTHTHIHTHTLQEARKNTHPALPEEISPYFCDASMDGLVSYNGVVTGQ
jgi:hypothetical protein